MKQFPHILPFSPSIKTILPVEYNEKLPIKILQTSILKNYII